MDSVINLFNNWGQSIWKFSDVKTNALKILMCFPPNRSFIHKNITYCYARYALVVA